MCRNNSLHSVIVTFAFWAETGDWTKAAKVCTGEHGFHCKEQLRSSRVQCHRGRICNISLQLFQFINICLHWHYIAQFSQLVKSISSFKQLSFTQFLVSTPITGVTPLLPLLFPDIGASKVLWSLISIWRPLQGGMWHSCRWFLSSLSRIHLLSCISLLTPFIHVQKKRSLCTAHPRTLVQLSSSVLVGSFSDMRVGGNVFSQLLMERRSFLMARLLWLSHISMVKQIIRFRARK